MTATDGRDAPELRDARSFRHWVPVTLRPSDIDPWGHVNNVAYAAFVSAGRTAFMFELLEKAGVPMNFVVASIKIDYRNELKYPGTVDVGTRPLRVGGKSIALGHGIFRDGALAATAESVLACRDKESRRTIPVPDAVRRLLEG